MDIEIIQAQKCQKYWPNLIRCVQKLLFSFLNVIKPVFILFYNCKLMFVINRITCTITSLNCTHSFSLLLSLLVRRIICNIAMFAHLSRFSCPRHHHGTRILCASVDNQSVDRELLFSTFQPQQKMWDHHLEQEQVGDKCTFWMWDSGKHR